MTRSLDMCRCGRRRLIMPQHPHGFEAGDEVEPLLVGGESTLSLGYWGGDRESTLMRLSVAHAQLIIDILPYTGQSAAELQARGLEQHVITSNPQIVEGQGGEPAYVTYDAVTVDPRQGSYVLSDLKGHLAKRGALEFPSGFPCGHRTLHLTPYAITAVDEATGTVSILPNRWFKVIDTAKDEALHVC